MVWAVKDLKPMQVNAQSLSRINRPFLSYPQFLSQAKARLSKKIVSW